MSTASDFWTGTFSLVAVETARTTVNPYPLGLDRLQIFSNNELPDDFDTNPDSALLTISTSPLSPALATTATVNGLGQTLTLGVIRSLNSSIAAAVLTQTSITTFTATFVLTRTGPSDAGIVTFAVTATKLTPTPNLYLDLGDGAGVAVGAVNSGRLRYNDTTGALEVSLDGAAYVRILTGAGTFFEQGGNSFGATAILGTNDGNALQFETNGTSRWQITVAGHLQAVADNTYDIGAAGANRPAHLYLGAGAVGTPALTINETDTGFYSDGTADRTSIAAGGFKIGHFALTGGFADFSFLLGLATAPPIRGLTAAGSGLYWPSTTSVGLTADQTGVATFTSTQITLTQAIATTGNPKLLTLTPAAHTTLTGEASSLVLTAVTQQWASASGAQALLRAVVFNAPTYDMDGAATITTAITQDITGPPIAGTTAAMTNAYGLRVNNTASAAVALTTSAGIQVLAPQTTGGGTITNPRALIAGGTATIAFANGATFNYHVIDVPAHTVTVSNTAMTLATATAAAVSLGQVTISSTQNITNAATLYINNAPTMAGGGAITNAYALWVDNGNIRSDGVIFAADGSTANPSYAFTNYTTSGLSAAAGAPIQVSMSTEGTERTRWSSNGMAQLSGRIFCDTYGATSGTSQIITFDQSAGVSLTPSAQSTTKTAFNITQAVNTGGTTQIFTITGGASTGQTASVEASDVAWDLSRTVQFATGALATQRAIVFDSVVTYAFVGASTITQAIGVHVTGSPTQGANCTITSAFDLVVGGGAALGGAGLTLASAAGATWRQIITAADTLTLSGSTNLTSSCAVAGLYLDVLTITSGSALTVTTAATLYIAGQVAQAGSTTITNKYAIFVDAGLCRFDGNGTHVFEIDADTTAPGASTGRIPFKDTSTGGTRYLVVSDT